MRNMQHTFQVDLRGMIDLLSEHLYGGPEVYIRELLQNGVDAITARAAREPGHQGRLTLTLTGGDAPTLEFTDDGVGLTEAEVHEFLATIGRSSKRGAQDFIGQFGIGLLSCFVVANEIELITRSLKGTPAIRWTGHADGRYTLAEHAGDVPFGTRIILRAKAGREEYFEPERVRELCANYGGLLPYPIEVRAPGQRSVVNERGAPWQREYATPGERHAALLAYGEELLGSAPVDAVELRADSGGVHGVAFVLPWTPSLAARGKHRVYLRGMLLSEDSENVVPEWAFFVKCVLNAEALRPNAARDALHEDATLRAARDELGDALRAYLLRLSREDPARLRALISLHFLSIKALAADDDDFYALFVPWLPFDTTLGRMTLPEYLQRTSTVRFVSDLNLFRQVAQVATATGRPVVHAVYTYDATLLRKYAHLHPETTVEELDADAFTADFTALTPAEREDATVLQRVARDVLAEFECTAHLARYRPSDLTALYLPRGGNFTRDLRRTRETVSGLWADVLGDLDELAGEHVAELHLNFDNPTVRRAATLPDGPVLRRVIGMLYVQALLLGHHPLGAREMRLLNDGMLELISWTLQDVDSGRSLN